MQDALTSRVRAQDLHCSALQVVTRETVQHLKAPKRSALQRHSRAHVGAHAPARSLAPLPSRGGHCRGSWSTCSCAARPALQQHAGVVSSATGSRCSTALLLLGPLRALGASIRARQRGATSQQQQQQQRRRHDATASTTASAGLHGAPIRPRALHPGAGVPGRSHAAQRDVAELPHHQQHRQGPRRDGQHPAPAHAAAGHQDLRSHGAPADHGHALLRRAAAGVRPPGCCLRPPTLQLIWEHDARRARLRSDALGRELQRAACCALQGRFSFYLTSQGEEATVVASAAALDPKDMVRAAAGPQHRHSSSRVV